MQMAVWSNPTRVVAPSKPRPTETHSGMCGESDQMESGETQGQKSALKKQLISCGEILAILPTIYEAVTPTSADLITTPNTLCGKPKEDAYQDLPHFIPVFVEMQSSEIVEKLYQIPQKQAGAQDPTKKFAIFSLKR